MAKAGDSFIVELSQSHVAWGTYRFTNSREPIREKVIYLSLLEMHVDWICLMVMEQIILIYGEKIYLNANLWMDIFMEFYRRKIKVGRRYLCETICRGW